MSRRKRLARARLEAQRRKLQKAQAILICAVHASIHDLAADYGDIMSVVVDMIDDVIVATDSVELYRDDGSDAGDADDAEDEE